MKKKFFCKEKYIKLITIILFLFLVFISLYFASDLRSSDLELSHFFSFQDLSTGVSPARFPAPRILYTYFPPENNKKRDSKGRPFRILITGGAGFIGSQLGAYFHQRGYEVILIDNLAFGYDDNLLINNKRFGQFILSDVLDERTYKYYEGVDTVFHFAAISSLPVCQQYPRYASDVNIAGVASVLEASRLAGIRRFIFSSTSAVYENNNNNNNNESILLENLTVKPHLLYSLSKYQGELLTKGYGISYDMDIVIMRFFNVYGPHQDFRRKSPPFTSYIAKELIRGRRPILHGSGKQRRDYVYITDLIDLAEKIMLAPNVKGEIINVASGIAYSTEEMFNIALNILNKTNIIPIFHSAKAFWDAYPNLRKGYYPLNPKILEKEVEKCVLGSYEKAEKLVGWKPKVSMKEGLQNVLDYIQKMNINDLDKPIAWPTTS